MPAVELDFRLLGEPLHLQARAGDVRHQDRLAVDRHRHEIVRVTEEAVGAVGRRGHLALVMDHPGARLDGFLHAEELAGRRRR